MVLAGCRGCSLHDHGVSGFSARQLGNSGCLMSCLKLTYSRKANGADPAVLDTTSRLEMHSCRWSIRSTLGF